MAEVVSILCALYYALHRQMVHWSFTAPYHHGSEWQVKMVRWEEGTAAPSRHFAAGVASQTVAQEFESYAVCRLYSCQE
jgi:hypothetical protein